MARILVVEDESAIAELVAINLRHAGHEVTRGRRRRAGAARGRCGAARPGGAGLDAAGPVRPGAGAPVARRGAHARHADHHAHRARRGVRQDRRPGCRCRRLPGQALLDAGADGAHPRGAAAQGAASRWTPWSSWPSCGWTRPRGASRGASARRSRRCGSGPTEFRLLHFLMTHPERVHSRSQLLDRVWGDHVFIEERTVDVHVKRLRDALSAGAVRAPDRDRARRGLPHQRAGARGVGLRRAIGHDRLGCCALAACWRHCWWHRRRCGVLVGWLTRAAAGRPAVQRRAGPGCDAAVRCAAGRSAAGLVACRRRRVRRRATPASGARSPT